MHQRHRHQFLAADIPVPLAGRQAGQFLVQVREHFTPPPVELPRCFTLPAAAQQPVDRAMDAGVRIVLIPPQQQGQELPALRGGNLVAGEFAQAQDQRAPRRHVRLLHQPVDDERGCRSPPAQVVQQIGAQSGVRGVAQERPDILGVTKLHQQDSRPRLPSNLPLFVRWRVEGGGWRENVVLFPPPATLHPPPVLQLAPHQRGNDVLMRTQPGKQQRMLLVVGLAGQLRQHVGTVAGIVGQQGERRRSLRIRPFPVEKNLEQGIDQQAPDRPQQLLARAQRQRRLRSQSAGDLPAHVGPTPAVRVVSRQGASGPQALLLAGVAIGQDGPEPLLDGVLVPLQGGADRQQFHRPGHEQALEQVVHLVAAHRGQGHAQVQMLLGVGSRGCQALVQQRVGPAAVGRQVFDDRRDIGGFRRGEGADQVSRVPGGALLLLLARTRPSRRLQAPASAPWRPGRCGLCCV